MPMKYLICLVLAVAAITGCAKSDNSGTAAAAYYCPMHPEVTSEKPSVCPICHMDLVKTGGDAETDKDEMLSQLNISGFQQTLSNVRTAIVKKTRRDHVIRAFSVIDFAEPNRKTVSARFSGRAEKLLKNQTGQWLQAGEPLLIAYSPDIIKTENELLAYLTTRPGLDTALQESALTSLRKRLDILGLSESQINELERTRQVHWKLPVLSPFSGQIIRKNITEGSYFSEGDVLFELDDISVLWNTFDVYESDIASLRHGQTVKTILQAFPNDTFQSRITFISPAVNPATRTLKVRTEINNNDYRIKPQMYGESLILIGKKTALYVPQSSVLLTGNRNVVWIRKDKTAFIPAVVTLGIKSGDEYEITAGLSEGDEIAVTGGFLIDSESQLNGFFPQIDSTSGLNHDKIHKH